MKSIGIYSRDTFKWSNLPEVTIVMPSFNQAGFIGQSISSVLDQKVEGLELIVMDGGSTDGTHQVLEKLSSDSNGRLKWYSEADHGAAHAINKAFAVARAPVIGWLNSDDLYAAGAIEKALLFFNEHTDMLMLYGQGRHIDEFGKELDVYPTLPPTTAFETFKDGCFICQPTVFFQRELLDDVGLLNEDLLASFDFDLWLRVFQKHQQRIGFIDEILAYSRLHINSKTSILRRNVALEGMKILSSQFGTAPGHWLLSYFDEVFGVYPHRDGPVDIVRHCHDLISEASGYMGDDEAENLRQNMASDLRFRIALPDAFINIYPDGWLPPVSCLRVRAVQQHWDKIRLTCRHASPRSGALQISIITPWGETLFCNVKKNGKFSLTIDLPADYKLPSYWSFIVKSDNYFIPAAESGTDDTRELAFKLNKLRLEY